MKQLLFATENEAKVKTFLNDLKKNNIQLLSLNDIDDKLDVEENGKTVCENALIKARAYYNKTHITTMGMDDGLYIDGIPDDLQPGLYVRRVNGKRLTDNEMIEHYSNLVKKYGKNGKLNCKWIYGLAIIKDGIENTYKWEKENFYIVEKPSNKIDVGYPLNSISINKKLNKYFSEITEEEKDILNDDITDVIKFIINNI